MTIFHEILCHPILDSDNYVTLIRPERLVVVIWHCVSWLQALGSHLKSFLWINDFLQLATHDASRHAKCLSWDSRSCNLCTSLPWISFHYLKKKQICMGAPGNSRQTALATFHPVPWSVATAWLYIVKPYIWFLRLHSWSCENFWN